MLAAALAVGSREVLAVEPVAQVLSASSLAEHGD